MRRTKKPKIINQVLVEDYAAEGKCLARIDGKVIFIEGAIPGDRVDVRIHKSKKDWAEGSAIHFHEKAPHRIAARCAHIGVCGGCQWQELPYDWQLRYKQQQVEQTLKRIGKIELPPLEPIVGSQSVFQYRNKIEYTFSNKRFLLPSELNDPTILAASNVVGFHARGFFDKVVDITTCHLQAEPTNQIRLFIKAYAQQHQLSFYDYRSHTGFLRNLQIRICETGQVMVNLIVGENNPSLILPLLEAIQKEFPSITTLLYTVNLKWNDSIFDLEPIPFTGHGFIEEELFNARYNKKFHFKIGPRSFFQTNTRQAEKLYQLTEEAAGLTGQETLYDLYCGTGSIGIFMSPGAKKIIGVEQVAAAIDDARENAALNNLNNTSFFAGDVIDICTSDFFAAQGQADVVVTDPPRAGMHSKLIEKLIEIGAPTVVYVSCNPATQARDLQLLDAHYQVTKVQPVDMFPHTHHIENIVQLKRR